MKYQVIYITISLLDHSYQFLVFKGYKKFWIYKIKIGNTFLFRFLGCQGSHNTLDSQHVKLNRWHSSTVPVILTAGYALRLHSAERY